MRQIKNGEKYSGTYGGGKKKFSGVAQIIDEEVYLFHNSTSIGGYKPAGGPKGFKHAINLDNTNIISLTAGGSNIFFPTVGPYEVRLDDDRVIFGCGDFDASPKEIRDWVAAKLKDPSIWTDMESAIGDNDIDFSEEDCERLDYLINDKSTAFAKQLYKALKSNGLPEFKSGDYFTATINGNEVSGRVHVSKGGVITYCHNEMEIDDYGTNKDDAFGYPATNTHESPNSWGDGAKYVKKVTADEVEKPTLHIEIGGDDYEVFDNGNEVSFGCGAVVLSKESINNWLEVRGSGNKQIEDFLAIEKMLEDRGDSYDDLDPTEVAGLREMCAVPVKKAAKKKAKKK